MKKEIFKTILTAVLVTSTMLVLGCKPQQKTFTIAYLPDEMTNSSQNVRAGLAKDLEKVIGMEVKEYAATDYNSIIEGMRSGNVDIAIFGAFSFALAYEETGAEPIAICVGKGKTVQDTCNYSFFVTQKNRDDINSISDLKGKTFVFCDASSTSGNLVPSAEIMKVFKDVSIDDLHTNGKFFESVSYSGNHTASAQAVAKGDVDAAPVAMSVFNPAIEKGILNKDDFKIFYTSGSIPANPMTIRGDLPEDLKKKVKDFIVNYENEEYFENVMNKKGGRFAAVTLENYKDIIDLYHALYK